MKRVMNNCPICFNSSLQQFITRKNVPVHQHLIYNNEFEAEKAIKGDLELKLCKHCGFLFNAAFDEDKLSYGPAYENSQYFSSIFMDHINYICNLLISKEIHKKTIIEIGCGDGFFLKHFFSKAPTFKQAFGFDPSYKGEESLHGEKLKFLSKYLDQNYSINSSVAIICRHLIEHIKNPNFFFNVLKKITKKNIHVFFETPDLHWILKNQVMWDFFYEHCSYFTVDSLSFALSQAGFSTTNSEKVFNNQYLWHEGKFTKKNAAKPKLGDILLLIENYQKKEKDFISNWKTYLSDVKGKIAIWSAGAKGVTFANLIDPEKRIIDSLIDINTKKQDKFIPISAHPIISPNDIKKREIRNIINMNPNYLFEIKNTLKEMQITVNFIEVK